MVQDVLADDGCAVQLTDADRRGLTPLFCTHVAPCSQSRLSVFELDAVGLTVVTRQRSLASPSNRAVHLTKIPS